MAVNPETDPKDLTDEELDEVLGIEPNEADEELEDKPDEEVEDEETEDEEEPEESEEKPDKEDPKPSKREQKRLRDLLQKYGDPDDKKPESPQVKPLDYREFLDADEEILKQLEEDRKIAAAASKTEGKTEGYNEGLEKAKSIQWNTRLEIDAPLVNTKHPELDKDSDDFDEDVADDINTMYLILSGFDSKNGTVANPDIRYRDFVDSMFGLADRIASKKTEEVTKVVKKQAARTGLRPDGSGASKINLSKNPQDMTDKELDAFLASQGLASR